MPPCGAASLDFQDTAGPCLGPQGRAQSTAQQRSWSCGHWEGRERNKGARGSGFQRKSPSLQGLASRGPAGTWGPRVPPFIPASSVSVPCWRALWSFPSKFPWICRHLPAYLRYNLDLKIQYLLQFFGWFCTTHNYTNSSNWITVFVFFFINSLKKLFSIPTWGLFFSLLFREKGREKEKEIIMQEREACHICAWTGDWTHNLPVTAWCSNQLIYMSQSIYNFFFFRFLLFWWLYWFSK